MNTFVQIVLCILIVFQFLSIILSPFKVRKENETGGTIALGILLNICFIALYIYLFNVLRNL